MNSKYGHLRSIFGYNSSAIVGLAKYIHVIYREQHRGDNEIKLTTASAKSGLSAPG